MGSELGCKKITKDNAHIGDVLTYVALGILGQSTRTHWNPPYVLTHIWSFVQLFCLVAHSSMSVRKQQHNKIFIQTEKLGYLSHRMRMAFSIFVN